MGDFNRKNHGAMTIRLSALFMKGISTCASSVTVLRRHLARDIEPVLALFLLIVNVACLLGMYKAYCRSANIREVFLFANFANSRIQESRENYYYNRANKENENSRVLNFMKSP